MFLLLRKLQRTHFKCLSHTLMNFKLKNLERVSFFSTCLLNPIPSQYETTKFTFLQPSRNNTNNLTVFRPSSTKQRVSGISSSALEHIVRLIAKIPVIAKKIQNYEGNKGGEEYSALCKESNFLNSVYEAKEELDKINKLISELLEMKNEDDQDVEMLREVELELKEQKRLLPDAEEKLLGVLLPPPDADASNTVLELRAGAGGAEASIFVGEMYELYKKFALKNKLKMKELSVNRSEFGLKEVSVAVSGTNAHGLFKYEAGTHRVQRIPSTETKGRIHTSTITVAVVPELETAKVEFAKKDLKIEFYKSSGPGGQSVNTSDSCCRITHIATGISATCQDERSPMANKEIALHVLKTRIFQREQEKLIQERREAVLDQIGAGDRSSKIRTYNFPQDRFTDHRLNFSGTLSDIITNSKLDVIKELLDKEARFRYLASL